MKSVHGVIFLLCIITFNWSCSGKPPEPSRIGVFVDTGAIVELNSFAKQISSRSYEAPDQAKVLEAGHVNSFYVNMPDVIITESKIVWLGTVQTQILESELELLETQVEKTSDGVYKVSSTALQSKSGGLVGLKVVMPIGTPDRIYMVRLK